MTTLRIALIGLQPGSAPLEIGTQGLLHIPAPAQQEEDKDGGFLIPIYFRPPPRERVDCLIQVEGVTARLTSTRKNLASHLPTTEELDILDDLAFCDEYNRKVDEAEEEAADERANERFWERWTQAQELRQQRREQRFFREAASHLAKQIRQEPDFEGLGGVIVGLVAQNEKLRARVEALEAAQAPKSPPRKKGK